VANSQRLESLRVFLASFGTPRRRAPIRILALIRIPHLKMHRLAFAPARCLSRGPSQRASAEEVDVEVEDGLAGAGADVEDGAVALFDVALAGDLGGGEMAAADEFGVGGFGFFQSREMFLGND